MTKIKKIFSFFKWKTNLFIVLIIGCGLFYKLIILQTENFDASFQLNNFIENKKVLPLSKWKIEFEKCKNRQCTPIGNEVELDFPDISKLKKTIASLPSKPTHAYITHNYTKSELQWLSKLKRTAILTIPRSVQHSVTIIQGVSRTTLSGFGSNIHFNISKNAIKKYNKILLKFNFNGYPWFGPSDLPIVIAKQGTVSSYSQLPFMQLLSDQFNIQLELGIPVLLTAMAIVLDQSIAFSLLALFSFVRSLRFFLYQQGQFSGREEPVLNMLIYLTNSIAPILLFLFLFNICHFPKKKNKSLIIFLALLSASVFSVPLWDKDYIQHGDLWSDLAMAIGGIVIVISAFILNIQRLELFKPVKEISLDEQSTHISNVTYNFRTVLILTSLFFLSWANYLDLNAVYTGGFKDDLFFGHRILLPSLIVAALLEIGSIARKMLFFGNFMVRTAFLEKDMKDGEEIQKMMLPPATGYDKNWRWKAYYYPATALGGDWFDIRIVNFKDKKPFLLACIADVTGHGIAAALMTSTISSHWGLWCQNLEKENAPKDSNEMEIYLKNAPNKIHAGLTAMRHNDGCTAIFLLLNFETLELTYCCAGHPGVIIGNRNSFSYHATLGTRPGFEKSSPSWEAKTTQIKKDDRVCIYTDGIAPPKVAIGRWLKTFQRTFAKSGELLPVALLKSIRKNSKLFRKDKDIEDDMTLIVIQPKKENT